MQRRIKQRELVIIRDDQDTNTKSYDSNDIKYVMNLGTRFIQTDKMRQDTLNKNLEAYKRKIKIMVTLESKDNPNRNPTPNRQPQPDDPVKLWG